MDGNPNPVCYSIDPLLYSLVFIMLICTQMGNDFEAFQKVKGALGLERKRSSGWRSVRK
jgi:hypothetical protein